jgi:hypothetical protein
MEARQGLEGAEKYREPVPDASSMEYLLQHVPEMAQLIPPVGRLDTWKYTINGYWGASHWEGILSIDWVLAS